MHVIGMEKQEAVLVQPRAKDYGGMGLAKPSLWIDLRDDTFMDRFLDMYREHIEVSIVDQHRLTTKVIVPIF